MLGIPTAYVRVLLECVRWISWSLALKLFENKYPIWETAIES